MSPRSLAASVASWRLLPLAVLVLIGLLLAPAVHAPFFSDDVSSSEMTGYRELADKGLLQHGWEATKAFVTELGRPQLLTTLPGHPVFETLGDHRALYHLYLVLFTVLDAWLLFLLLTRMGVSRPVALLAIALAGATLQLRTYHDPLLAFAGLVQAMFAALLASMLAFVKWLEAGRRRHLAWAIGWFLVTVMLYEVAYPLALAHIAVALAYRRGRAAARAAAPFVAIAVLFFALSYLARLTSSGAIGNYTPGGGPWTVLRTYALQLVSPLPTSFLLFEPNLAGSPTPAEWVAALWRGLAVAGLVVVMGLAIAARGPAPAAGAQTVRPQGGTGAAVGFALAIIVAPPVLLAVAPKYQIELTASRGYLPVLMQIFGVATLLALGLSALVRAAQRRSTATLVTALGAAAMLAGLVAGITGFNNIRVVAWLRPERDSRDLLERAADRDVFQVMPAGATLLFTDRDVSWMGVVPYRDYDVGPLMLADKTGRIYDARRMPPGDYPQACPAPAGKVRPACAPLQPQAAWVRVRLGRQGGTVIIAPFDREDGSRRTAAAQRLWVYRESEGRVEAPPRLLADVGRRKGGWRSDAVAWTRVRGGDGWALFSAELTGARPVASTIDDTTALIDFTALPDPPTRVRLLGTKELLP